MEENKEVRPKKRKTKPKKMGAIMEPKKAYLSKTLIINAIVALSAMFFPSVGEYVSAHPSEIAIAFSVLNIGLRLVSSQKLEFY